MRLLALDQAGITGFAYGDILGEPVSGTLKLPAKLTLGEQLIWFRQKIVEIVISGRVDTIVYESVFMSPKTMTHAAKAYKICGVIELLAAERKCEVYEMPPTSWRKTIGAPTQAPRQVPKSRRRDWLKDATMRRLSEMGLSYRTNDEADAIGIWLGFSSEVLKPPPDALLI